MNNYECELSVNLLIEWQETGEESYINAQQKKLRETTQILRANGIRVKEATGEFIYPDHQVQDDDKDPIQDEFDRNWGHEGSCPLSPCICGL